MEKPHDWTSWFLRWRSSPRGVKLFVLVARNRSTGKLKPGVLPLVRASRIAMLFTGAFKSPSSLRFAVIDAVTGTKNRSAMQRFGAPCHGNARSEVAQVGEVEVGARGAEAGGTASWIEHHVVFVHFVEDAEVFVA